MELSMVNRRWNYKLYEICSETFILNSNLIFFLNAFTVYHVILNDFGILNLSTCMKDPETKFIIVTCQIKLHQLILESHRRNQFNPWQQSQMIHNAWLILRIAVLHVLTHLGTQKYLLKCQLYQHKQVEQFDREHLLT